MVRDGQISEQMAQQTLGQVVQMALDTIDNATADWVGVQFQDQIIEAINNGMTPMQAIQQVMASEEFAPVVAKMQEMGLDPYQKALSTLQIQQGQQGLLKGQQDLQQWNLEYQTKLQDYVAGWWQISREQATQMYWSTPAVRNFNPWNIMDTGFGGEKVAWERFTRFASPQEWFQALVAKIQNIQAGNSKVYSPNMTLTQYMSKYAPSSDNNNPQAYAQQVANHIGIDVNTKIWNIDPVKLAEAHAKHEDWASYRMLNDLWVIWWAWQVWFSDSQKNLMDWMDAKNLTKWEQDILKKNWLTESDIYTYKADKKNWQRTDWLDDNTIKRVNGVMDDLDTDMISKTFQKGQEAFDFAQNVAKWVWATDNQWLIYAFAKAMDPDSVVREGEYATVQTYAQTWGDKLGMDINRVLNGEEFISEEAKKNIVNTIKTKYNSQKNNYENLRKNKIKIIDDIAWKKVWEDILPSLVNETILWPQQTSTVKAKRWEFEPTAWLQSSPLFKLTQ